MKLSDFEERFNYLEQLTYDICDDVVFNTYSLSIVKAFLLNSISLGAPIPYIYLINNNKIRVEWSLFNWEVSADFEDSIKFHAMHFPSEICKEHELKITDSNAVESFTAFIKQFAPTLETKL